MVACEGPGLSGSIYHHVKYTCLHMVVLIYGLLCSVSACSIRCARRRIAVVVDLRVAHEGPGSLGSIYHHVNYTYPQPSVEINLQARQALSTTT